MRKPSDEVEVCGFIQERVCTGVRRDEDKIAWPSAWISFVDE